MQTSEELQFEIFYEGKTIRATVIPLIQEYLQSYYKVQVNGLNEFYAFMGFDGERWQSTAPTPAGLLKAIGIQLENYFH